MEIEMSNWKRYQCPSCGKQFAFEGIPRFCPHCSYDTQEETLSEVICSPGILRGKSRGVDNIYKAEEEASQFRAHQAMEMGLSTEEANGLKITNMRDNAQIGETSEIPVNNPVSQAMAAQPQNFGFNQGAQQQAVQYSQMAHVDPKSGRPLPAQERNAGLRAQNMLKTSHQAQGYVTSDTPALETQMPGYRRRM